jgi:hypothetical protein
MLMETLYCYVDANRLPVVHQLVQSLQGLSLLGIFQLFVHFHLLVSETPQLIITPFAHLKRLNQFFNECPFLLMFAKTAEDNPEVVPRDVKGKREQLLCLLVPAV